MNIGAFTFLSWLPLPFLGVANGIFREAALKPLLGGSAALPVSGVTLVLLITAYLMILRRFRTVPAKSAALMGAVWLVLTLAFEFLFGYFVARDSLNDLLTNYDVTTGNLWPAVVLWAAAGPYLFLRADPSVGR